jgi:methionine synthase II (cobalamin-independent)
VTDGEFRRDYWHLDFLRQLDGVTLGGERMTFAAGTCRRWRP